MPIIGNIPTNILPEKEAPCHQVLQLLMIHHCRTTIIKYWNLWDRMVNMMSPIKANIRDGVQRRIPLLIENSVSNRCGFNKVNPSD
jgi:hypothetical protein